MAKEECQLCRNTADESGQRIWFSSRTPAGGGGESSINVISVLNQHFWFQFDADTASQSYICLSCWSKVDAFHEFYEEVLAAHTIKQEVLIHLEDEDIKHVHLDDGELKPEKNNDDDPVGSDPDLGNHDNNDDDDYTPPSSPPESEQPNPIRRSKGRLPKTPSNYHTKRSTSMSDASQIEKYFRMKCTECETAFSGLADARLHYKIKHENPSGYLMCCERQFFTPKAINDHCRFHEDPRKHKCSLCDMIYSSAVRLETHRIAKHNSNGNQSSSIYECRPCDRTFTTSIELTCHEISHTLSATTGDGDQPPARQLDEDTIVRMYVSRICELCGHLMDTFTDALHHHRVVHQQTGYLTCCGKRYFKKFRLLQHCQWHADPRKFDCPICSRNFHDGVSLREHTVRLHGPDDREPLFQCEMCDRRFQHRHQMSYHQRKDHLRDEDKKYECYHCGKRFVFLSFLQNHMKSVHDPVPSFVCDICAKCFRSQGSYELHYTIEHTNICQKVQCQLCGKWLKHSKTLARHMFFHRAQPETCEQCGHVAPSKRALYSHQRLVHREPTHKCLVCGKMFKKTHTLKEHMAIHAGITDLYTCWYCPKTFRSSSNMYKHRRMVHSAEFEAQKLDAAAANLNRSANDKRQPPPEIPKLT